MNNQWFSKLLFGWWWRWCCSPCSSSSIAPARAPHKSVIRIPGRGPCQAHQVRHPPGGRWWHRRSGHHDDDKRIRSTATYLDRGLVGDLINNNVKFDVKPREEQSP